MPTRLVMPIVLACFLLVGGAVAACAHAYPNHSDPGAGATLSTAPHQVRIWFTEAIEPAFSTMTVIDASGRLVGQGKATVDSKDPKLLEIGLMALTPGTYRVKWRVVAVDTHRTEGDFTFTVKP